MKTIITFLATAILSVNGYAQYSFKGSWEGKLNIGKEIRVTLNIKDTGGHKFFGTMDSPDQMAYGVPCDSVIVYNDSVKITISNGQYVYHGRMADSNLIAGVFCKGNSKLPLTLTKTYHPFAPNRPQTPKPPFPYTSEDVTYHSADHSIQYGATITIPKGKGPFPALLLITGSGQQNRDEEIAAHRPFAVIADYLTQKGYIVLRVDDRGIGKTTGDFKSSTTEDFMNDAKVSLNYLRSRQEVDKQKIGLLGHSEGGMIAPMIAATEKDINFIILLAGPGVKIRQLMEEQNAAVLEKSGVSKATIDSYLVLYKEIIESAINAGGDAQFTYAVENEVKDWIAKTPAKIVSEATHIYDNNSRDQYSDKMVKALSSKWYKYFLAADPQVYLEKLSCKVLALNGEKDVQVIAKSNLAGIKTSLAKSKSPIYNTVEMKGMNHLFQKCTICSVQEYAQLEETFSPDALKTISDWLNTNVK